MSLEKITAAQIVRNVGMSDRPGYYSGRGATISDLNSQILEGIYQEIKSSHGEEAAKQYVQMVVDISKLSATDFLLTLYQLERNDWQWDKILLGDQKGIEIEKDRNGNHSRGQTFATMAGIMFGNHRIDETPYIREEFLRNHGVRLPGEQRRGHRFFDDEY